MPFINVRVNGQDRRVVYTDGNYDDPEVRKAPGPFAVPPGRHTFETLRGRSVDSRATVSVKANQDLVVTDFKPVDPPEPID